jgi:hypothetical protein
MIHQDVRRSDDVVRRGQEIYDRQIRALVEPDNVGRFIAIDINSGDYAVGPDYLPLCDTLENKHPDANCCILRIGHPAAVRLGGMLRPAA